MVPLSYDRILLLIEQNTSLSQSDIENKIKLKVDEFSGLISLEGAAHVIANELGVDLLNEMSAPQKIRNISSGLRDCSVIGKVLKKYPVSEFERNGQPGKVSSILLGDETGTIRMTFWHDDILQLDTIQEDDILKIAHVSSKDNKGRCELTYMRSTNIEKNPANVQIDVARSNVTHAPHFARKLISQVALGEQVSLVGTIVQLFKPSFYIVDKTTQRKVTLLSSEKFDETKHAYGYVLNFILDDGSDSLRCVFFREMCARVFGLSDAQFLEFKDNEQLFDQKKKELLGSFAKVQGRIVENQMFKHIEIIVNEVQINPDPQIEELNSLYAECTPL